MTDTQIRVLGIKGSPRKRANSTILLEQVLAGAQAAGAETTLITSWKLEISPCLACYACRRDGRGGRCAIEDDFQVVYSQILASDVVVLATPVYFGAVSAQVKPLIDRCESFWGMTYRMGVPMPAAPSGGARKGILIATAGQDREIMYAGPKVTFDFLMRSLKGEYYADLLYGDLDEPAGIRANNVAMARAFEIGRRVARRLEADES